MNFAHTEDRRMLADTLGRFVSEQYAIEARNRIAYGDEFDDGELLKWLRSYCRRLFSQQFKRSCLMDGPAVEPFSVSPRSGFRLPSDGMDSLYLAQLDALEKELGLGK